MKTFIISCLLILYGFGAEAQVRCQSLYRQPEAKEFISSLNEKYGKILYDESLVENMEQSFLPIKKYQFYKLKKLLKELNQNGSNFDSYELEDFVYRLDRLVFDRKFEEDKEDSSKVTARDKQILSEVRRSLLTNGIVKTFGKADQKSGFWRKFFPRFSQVFRWKYWRWPLSMRFQKIVGISIPVELAEKIALDGLDAHRAEVEKYLPKIRNKAVFNQFSRVINSLMLSALITVGPYMVYDNYITEAKNSEVQAVQQLSALTQISERLAKVDDQMQDELATLEIYRVDFAEKYHREPTARELQAAQKSIHATVISGLSN